MSDEEESDTESGEEEEEEEEDDDQEEEQEGEKAPAPAVAPAPVPVAEVGVKTKGKGEKESDKDEEEASEVSEDSTIAGLNLNKDCVKILRNAFQAFDQERKGVLGTEMIGIILELLGHSLSPAELDEIIREVDADGSGELEFDEFIILASKFLPEDSEEENPEQLKDNLKEAFRYYDKGGNGYITVADFKGILKEIDPDIPAEELDGMVREIDQDDSGTVDFDEFMSALQ